MRFTAARICCGLSIVSAITTYLLFQALGLQAARLEPAQSVTPRANSFIQPAPQAPLARGLLRTNAATTLPQRFEANRGQATAPVKFIARGQGFALLLSAREAVLRLRDGATGGAAWLRMQLVNANRRPRVAGLNEQSGRSHYFIGGAARRWITEVKAWSKVRYQAVWPGVDLIWYGNGQQFEHDFIVAPGADPARIKLAFAGAQSLRLDPDGALALRVQGGELRLLKPIAWQEVNGARREVACAYRLGANNQISFRLGSYNRQARLVIDPVLSYSTFLGGNNTDNGVSIAVDRDGNTYLVGSTASTDFPGASAVQAIKGNQWDAFVLKLNANGSGVTYATWLGGDGNDFGNAVAVDAGGNVYLAGDTSSPNFPTTTGARQRQIGGGTDAFVAKLNASGSALLYSTYLGGDGFDRALGVAVDAAGNAYLTGQTDAGNFPTVGLDTRRSGAPLFRSDNGGAVWEPSGNGLAASAVGGLALDPTNASTLYATAGAGLYRSIDGRQWQLVGGPPAVNGVVPGIFSVALAAATPAAIYLATSNGIYKSTDGGQTFALRSTGLFTPFVNTIIVDPATPTTLYAGTIQGAFKSVNGGDSWTAINNGLTDAPGASRTLSVRRLVVDPRNPATLYAATSRGVFKSVNGGGNWSGANNGFANVQAGLGPDILALVVDSLAPLTLYAGVSGFFGSVYKTTDGGANWQRMNAGLSISINGVSNPLTPTALAIDPTNPATIYVGTTFGVWRSVDGGASWSVRSDGLSSPAVVTLLVDRQGIVYAAVNAGTDAFAAKLNATGSALDYSLYLGGAQSDTGYGIAVDAAGNAWVTGAANSIDFPVNNARQATNAGFADAFVMKINPAGTELLFSSYLGGSFGDEARHIALDSAGDAYLTGLTGSTDFPLANALQGTYRGGSEAFITKLKSDGAELIYSTYLGGSGTDQAFSIAVDSRGSAWITGVSNSGDFPLVNPLQTMLGNFNNDAFVARLDAAGAKLLFSTYLGGQGDDRGNDIAVDEAGNAYVVGTTSSPNFPVANPLQPYRGATDAFITKLGANAELALIKADERDPVMVNNDLSYTLTVTNNGPDEAVAVILTDTLPAGVTFVSATASQGACSGVSTINCALGDLRAGDKTAVTITVKPPAVGAISNTASVTSAVPDLVAGNNLATQETRVAAQPSIAGRIRSADGAGLSGVTVSLSGAQSATTTTNGDGFYQFADLNVGGSFVVTPTRAGYVFNPPSRQLNNVTQDQTADFGTVACLFTISPVNRSFPAAGGTGTITINSPDPQCPWMARSNAPWLTITSAAMGQGSATLTFNVAPTDSSRSGALTVAGNTFTVWQEVNPCGASDFTSVKRFSAGRAAGPLATDDFNNDGRLDLAVGLESSRIAVLLGDGPGSFAAPVVYPSFVTAQSLVAADFNGDGWEDLVAAGGGLVLLAGTSTGEFGAPMQLNGGENPLAAAVADFNADGKLDLVAVGGDGNVSVLLATGAGGFAAPVNFGNFGSTPYPKHVAAGDFNGDDKPDLAVANSFGVSVFLNNSTGGFGAPARIEAAGRPEFVAAADFNKDGRAELAVPWHIEGKGAILVLAANAAGVFGAPTIVPLTALENPFGFGAIQLSIGDINSDGNLDLVATNANELIPVLGNGAGGFTAEARYSSVAFQRAALLRDFTGDGQPDLAVSNPGYPTGDSSLVALLINRGAGVFIAPRVYPAPLQAVDVLSRDFNGDGKLDLVTLGGACENGPCTNGGVAALRLGDGQGGFAPPRNFAVGNGPQEIITADFNGDGQLDLATANFFADNVSLLLHNGADGFNPVVNFAVSSKPRALAAGDFNNDGRTDLVVTHLNDALNKMITILLGNGAGGFANPTTFTTDRALTSIAVADLNSDGRADLIGGSFFVDSSPPRQGNISVLLGNGDGTFGAVRRFAGDVAASATLLFDFNGDGRLDIAAPTGGDSLAVLFGDGMGGLAAPVLYPLQRQGNAGTGPRDIARGDFNSDGRTDLAVTNRSGLLIEVLLDNGTGQFAPVAGSSAVNPVAVAVGDYNGDGRDDLAAVGLGSGFSSGSYTTVLLNNCAPSIAVTTVSAASFARATTSGAIVAAFGTALATTTQSAATIPLPTELGGVTVTVRDSAGVARPAPLFFVSPQQINYLIPPGTAPGGAVITINNAAGVVATGTAQVETIAPALFSAAASGQGVAAAVVLRVKADGTQTFEPVARYDEMQGRFVAVPIDLGAETDQLFLLLFGTGLRNRTSLFAVTARIGGLPVELLYAGAQGDFVGLDQVNLRLSRNLIGRGEVDIALIVDDRPTNTVKVNFK